MMNQLDVRMRGNFLIMSLKLFEAYLTFLTSPLFKRFFIFLSFYCFVFVGLVKYEEQITQT
ncbi:unnamed protein product [Arabidopsis halleri]